MSATFQSGHLALYVGTATEARGLVTIFGPCTCHYCSRTPGAYGERWIAETMDGGALLHIRAASLRACPHPGISISLVRATVDAMVPNTWMRLLDLIVASPRTASVHTRDALEAAVLGGLVESGVDSYPDAPDEPYPVWRVLAR